MKAQPARIVRGEAERPRGVFGDPDAAERGFARPRAAKLRVDPGENPLGRAMFAQRPNAGPVEGFEFMMNGRLRDARVVEIRQQVDRAQGQRELAYERAGWTTTAGSPSRRLSTQPTISAPGHASRAAAACATGTISVKPTPMLNVR